MNSVEGNWESFGKVGRYPFLGIDYLGKDVVGACLQYSHQFFCVWGRAMGLGGIDIIHDMFHVDFFSGHGRSYVLHELQS